jgi:hypothetical protein
MSDSATKSSARLEETDLLRLRHMLGGLLTLVALWGLVLVDNASPLATLIAIIATFAGLAFPSWLAARGDRFWNFTGWCVVAVALADLVSTGITDRAQLIPAVIRATLLIAVLRTMQPRSRREDMQLILLALFLGSVGGALSLSPVFAVQVFLFIPVSGGILFILNRLDGGPRTKLVAEDWIHFRWADFLRRLRVALTPGTMLFLGGALALVILWGAVIFTVLPRYRMDREMPFLQLPGKGRTGFSESVSLGGVGEILRDESVALRADTPARARPVANPYWRMIALDAYAGNEATTGFSLSPGAERFFRENESRGAEWTAESADPRDFSPAQSPGEWNIHLEGNVSRYMTAPGFARRIRFDKTQEWQTNDRVRLLRLKQQPSTTVHMLAQISGDSAWFRSPDRERRAFDAPSFGPSDGYPGTLLGLPTDGASRTALAKVVAEIGAKSGDAADFVTKAGDWLATRHAYALTDGYGRKQAAPGEPKDYLVRWIGSGATGWCEHYATSFVLLARSAGYPARLVTGFSGGEWNENENYLVVRMKHAHAWAEIYDRNAGLWRRADSTPTGRSGSVDTAQDRARISSFSGIAAWYDSLTMLWFRRVVNFEEADQREAAKAAANRLLVWGAELRERMKLWRAALAESVAGLREAPEKLAAPVGIALASGSVVYALLRLSRKLSARRVRRALDDDPRVRRFRERAGRALVKLDAFAKAGRPVDSGVRDAVETIRYGRPHEWPEPEGALNAVAPALRDAARRGK